MFIKIAHNQRMLHCIVTTKFVYVRSIAILIVQKVPWEKILSIRWKKFRKNGDFVNKIMTIKYRSLIFMNTRWIHNRRQLTGKDLRCQNLTDTRVV